MENEEEFVDLLDEQRRRSDLGFALRTFNPNPFKGASPCSTADLNKAVLESQYLRYMVKEVGWCDFGKDATKDTVASFSFLPSSSDRHGDRVIGGGGERGGLWDFGGNVSKPAAGVYQANGLRTQQGVQETLHQHLCQHRRTQHGQEQNTNHYCVLNYSTLQYIHERQDCVHCPV